MGVLSELVRSAADRAAKSASRASRSAPMFPGASRFDASSPSGRPGVSPQVVPDQDYIPPLPPDGVDVYPPTPPAGAFPDTDYFPPPPMPVEAYPQAIAPTSGAAREMEIRELIRQQRRDMRSMTVPPEPGRYRDDVFRSIGQGQ